MTTKISAAFVKAQKGFAPALKSSINPHFGKKYVDLAGCVEAVIDSLNNNGIGMMQQTTECETGVIVETVFIHESGETLSSGKLHVPASKNDAQGYGSALTYARRYSLMAACGIAPEDDDGNAASKQEKPEKKEKLPVLTKAEQQKAYESWLSTKADLMDEDGHIPPEKMNDAWFKLPPNVRTGINAWRKKVEEEEAESVNRSLDVKQLSVVGGI